MDLKLLENIVAVAEERSISRAAERLFISQPALSQQISKLEAQLGTPLFFRGKQNLSLTQAGKVYVDHAIRILNIRNDAYNQIYDIAASRKGSISIGVSPGRSPMIVSMVYAKFQKEFPDFTVQVFDYHCTMTEELLAQGRLDLGFSLLTDDEVSSKLPISHIQLERQDMYLVASRNHPLASRYHQGSKCPVIDLKLFRQEPFALPTKGAKIRCFADELFALHGMNPVIHYEVFNVQAITAVVSRSKLCTIIPASFLPEDDNLIQFRLKPNRFMDFAICWNSNHHVTTAEQYFIHLCQESYKQYRLLS